MSSRVLLEDPLVPGAEDRQPLFSSNLDSCSSVCQVQNVLQLFEITTHHKYSYLFQLQNYEMNQKLI